MRQHSGLAFRNYCVIVELLHSVWHLHMSWIEGIQKKSC